MGIFQNIKERFKERQQLAKEKKAFNQILQPKLRAVRRQVIFQEAIKQTKIEAKKEVQEIHTKGKSKGIFGSVLSGIGQVGRNIAEAQQPRRLKKVKKVRVKTQNPYDIF